MANSEEQFPPEDEQWDDELLERGLEILESRLGTEDTARFLSMVGAIGAGAMNDENLLFDFTPAEYILKVSLDGSDPLIWRRLRVSNTVTLDVLHEIVATAMGWDNSHLHVFTINDEEYGPTDEDEEGGDWEAEEMVYLGQLVTEPKSKFKYTYDLGDEWEHTIVLEKVLEIAPDAEPPMPEVLDGANACPPDDCGGIHNYYERLEILKNPKHPDYKEMKEEWPRKFDPAAFNKAAVNKRLRQYCMENDE